MIKVRQVSLSKGPFDGAKTIASHYTAWHGGELYVWDGSDDHNTFVHCKTALALLPNGEQIIERQRVKEWIDTPGAMLDAVPDGKGGFIQLPPLPPPMSMCLGIPPWRINAWRQLILSEDLQPGETND